MNILIANTQEFNPQIGGVERVSTLLARELLAMGHKVYFIAYYLSPFSNSYEPIVEQFLLPVVQDIVCEENIVFFERLVHEKQIDLLLNQAGNIVDFSELCIEASKRSSVKLISKIHINPDYKLKGLAFWSGLTPTQWLNPKVWRRALLYPWRHYKLTKEVRDFYRFLYEYSDAVILLSENFKPLFERLMGLHTLNKLHAIGNSSPFHSMAENFSNLNRKKQLLFVGRLNFSHKCPEKLLSIWAKLESKFPEWNLVFVGDGPDRQKLEHLIKQNNLCRVMLTGFTSPENYYRDSEILCMTSRIEGFAMVLIEAASFGVIPIAYNSFESLSDIIEHGVNGYVVPVFDEERYVADLSQLMSSQSLRAELRKNLPSTTEKFSTEVIMKKWITLFTNLCNQ